MQPCAAKCSLRGLLQWDGGGNGPDWGHEKTTDDSEGTPKRVSEKRPTREEIEDCLNEFVGVIKQEPPIYSAVKVNGKRAYSIARSAEKKGEDSHLA